MKSPQLLAATMLLLILGSSCHKRGLFPRDQHPFQVYLDSLEALKKADSIYINYQPVLLGYPSVKAPGTQAEIGFSFRTAVAGAINQLGIYTPVSGVSHTVTLWDSATAQILAQTSVTTTSAGVWAYADLARTGQVVQVQANHGYILGFNTLADGVPITADTIANEIYQFNGIYDLVSSALPNDGIPMIPFTRGDVTFDWYYEVNYSTPTGTTIFPASGYPESLFVIQFYGAVDIGFVPGF